MAKRRAARGRARSGPESGQNQTGGKKITTLLDSSEGYSCSKQPTQIANRISYKDATGIKGMHTIRHNLDIYRDIAYTVPAQQ